MLISEDAVSLLYVAEEWHGKAVLLSAVIPACTYQHVDEGNMLFYVVLSQMFRTGWSVLKYEWCYQNIKWRMLAKDWCYFDPCCQIVYPVWRMEYVFSDFTQDVHYPGAIFGDFLPDKFPTRTVHNHFDIISLGFFCRSGILLSSCLHNYHNFGH
jgi:hypothetical protein